MGVIKLNRNPAGSKWQRTLALPVNVGDQSVTFQNGDQNQDCEVTFDDPAAFDGVSSIVVRAGSQTTVPYKGTTTTYKAKRYTLGAPGSDTIPPG